MVLSTSVSESEMSDRGMDIRWKGKGEVGVVVNEFDLEVDEELCVESRLGEAFSEYLLEPRERFATEVKINSCSCSEIRDGAEGRGGRGVDGGPVGGGLVDGDGMCEGGAGNEERIRGTGARFERLLGAMARANRVWVKCAKNNCKSLTVTGT